MKDPDRIDLSPLDPARDPARWEQLLAATRLRVDAVLEARPMRLDSLTVVAGWARPILAAAAVALTLLGAALAAAGHAAGRPGPTSHAGRLAALSVGFAMGHAPTGADLARALRAEGRP
jgi:hypothetical protein